MASGLSQTDLRRVLDFLQDLHTFRDHEAFTQHLVRAAPSFIDADVCDNCRYDFQGHQVTYDYFPHTFPLLPDVQERLALGIAEKNTSLSHWRKVPFGQASTWTDIAPRSYWHKSVFYNEMQLAHQIPFCLVMGFPMVDARSLSLLAMHRNSKDFTEQERALLETIRPHVTQASTNALQVTALQQSVTALSDGIDQSAQAAGLVNAQGQIAWMTASAKALFASYGEDKRAVHHDRLPNPFWDWMRHQNGLLDHAETAPAASLALVLHRGPRTLTVRLIRNGTHHLLLLKEESQELNWEALSQFGLTTREREVLTWVLQGKSNPEMSQILGAKAGTIQKHLGSIYQKLGVEHRTALVAYVSELLRTAVN